MSTRSLTGDPVTDELVPVAQNLIGAVRDNDPAAVDEAFAAAADILAGRSDPAAALAVVCAAMVPEETSPSQLLLWWRFRAEYDRLVSSGVTPHIARELAAVGTEEQNEAASRAATETNGHAGASSPSVAHPSTRGAVA